MKPLKSRQLYFLDMSRGVKQFGFVILDSLLLPFMVIAAFAIRLGEVPELPRDWWLLPLASLVTVIPLYLLGYYNIVVRHYSNEMSLMVVFSTMFASMALAAASYMLKTDPSVTPRSVFIIYFMLSTGWLLASRVAVRTYVRWVLGERAGQRPVAIFGSGGAGREVAGALGNQSDYRVVAFVDDDRAVQGTTIQGVRVVDRKALEKLIHRGSVEIVLLAVPSVDRARRMEIISFLEGLPVEVKSVPAFHDIIAGNARIDDLRSIEIEDLLGREPVPPDEELLASAVTGKSVLVTGAGGSIGSELARQAAALGPRRLVLLDSSEFSLYRIESELAPICKRKGVELSCILESVVHRATISEVIAGNEVQTIYHAAAYKHVPIIEENERSGFDNNVMGTVALAEEAVRGSVERFILVSTDKAVRPTNVMGATKRMAELVVQALADRDDVSTIFSIVRFGNVLGSSGSVVPRFREQIEAGGPVTVTHPDVTRYFMTIPEAAQLVIQAGAMARGGEVFVLDMGEPIKILDLARTMIVMMGYSLRDKNNPDGDIEIVFSGLRPGEKLYEELLIGEQCIGTRHPKIMQANEERLSWEQVMEAIERFDKIMKVERGPGVRRLLGLYVTGYRSGVASS